MGGERKKTGGGAMSAVRGTAAALAVTGLLFLLPGLLVPGPEAKGDGQAAVGGENAPSGTAAAANGPGQQGAAAPAEPHTPVPPPANPGTPIDLVYPVVPGQPKPADKGPLTMKPTGKRP